MDTLLRRRLALVMVVSLQCTLGCATSSRMTVPTCAERVEVQGQHTRRGATLVFDHSFDGPWSRTDVVLERDGQQEVVSIPNLRPDAGRLMVGIVLGTVGGAVAAASGIQVATQGATFQDEGPFYGMVFGSTAAALGIGLTVTGWQPLAPPSFAEFCGPDD